VAQVDVSKLLEKAKEAADRRNYDYAIDWYLNALKLDPDNGQARRDLRMVELRLAKEKPPGFFAKGKLALTVGKVQTMYAAKKYDAAIEAAEEALRIDPTSVGTQLTLARAASAAGYRNAALFTLEDLQSTKANGNRRLHVESLRELGFLCEAMGRVPQAKQAWEQVKQLNTSDHDADQHLKNLYATDMSTKLQNAVDSTDKGSVARSMLKDKKTTEDLTAQEGELRTKEDVLRVIEITKAEIAKQPDDARRYGKLGDLYLRAESWEEARKAYMEAQAKDSTNYTWRFKQDDVDLARMNRELRLLAEKFKAGDVSVKDPYNAMRLKLLEMRLASYLQREVQYSTDSRIRYELGTVYFELAEIKKDNGLYDEAIKRYQMIYPDPKYRCEAGLRMGQGFTRKGQFDLALKRFDDTLRTLEVKDLRWKNLLYAKADTLELAGKKREALQAFILIYEIDVSFRDVSKRVDKLQAEGADKEG
jgi:tetratricopeptide (TPR) repeat protein